MINDSAYQYLDQSVFPILQREHSEKFSIAGTSVLVEHRGLPFLVTAAHVLRENGNQFPLVLLLENENIRLDGPAHLTQIIDGNDPDLAIFDLRRHASLMQALNGRKVISLADPEITPSHARQHFVVFGYPWRWAHYHGGSIKIESLKYITDESNESSYGEYALSREQHIIVKYDRAASIHQDMSPAIAPKPEGASGGPLLRILVDKSNYPVMLILEGILTKWNQNDVIMSTRKSVLRQFIDDTVGAV